MQPTTFRAVPFDENWINHDKIDIHAIYRRPILDDVGEQVIVGGVPQWDLTTGLPVRRHYDWVKKGFQYVTLADSKSLGNKNVVQGLRAKGLNPADFIMLRNRMVGQTPWNPALYLQSRDQIDRVGMDSLRILVERLGSDAVREVKRMDDPAFELPAHLRDIPPGGTAKELPAPKAATAIVAATVPALPRVARNSLAGRARKKAAKQTRRAAPSAPAAAETGAPTP